jgi:phosphatidate cytidylyltransferase
MNDVKKTTIKRIISALILAPVYVLLIVIDWPKSTPILVCSIVVTLACLFEFYTITDRGDEGRAFVKTGMAFAVVLNVVMYLYAFGRLYGYAGYIPPFDARVLAGAVAVFMSCILVLQLVTRPLKGGSYSLGITLLGLVYIAFSFSHIILMKALTNGEYYIIILSIVVILNDSAAYFGGVFKGKHKTNFQASPNKSWEGYFTGLLVGVLAMIITNYAYVYFFDKQLFGMIESLLLGIALSILGNIGDLVESAIKRDGSMKDSGSIVPGHGGILDVVDAMLFTFPLFYYYLILKGIR